MDNSPEIIVTQTQVKKRIDELGEQISKDYKDCQLVLIAVLKGAFIFAADLARAINLNLEIDFIRVASYGDATTTSGTIRLTKAPEIDLKGKDIIIVEDIIDTGTTITWLEQYFAEQKASSLKICTLVDKTERRTEEVNIDYVGFSLNEGFIIGYGMDYNERFRNLPDICTL